MQSYKVWASGSAVYVLHQHLFCIRSLNPLNLISLYGPRSMNLVLQTLFILGMGQEKHEIKSLLGS